MQYNFKLFFKNWRQSFFQAKGTHARLTRKRLGFLILFYIVWPVWGCIVWFSFLLDNVFFPKFKHRPVEKPLFIIGNFRSGSTYLQRLIARDKTNFASARTWDIFISPSIIQTKIFSVLVKIDSLFGSPVRRMFKRFDSKTLGQVDIHKISFFEPEEDENFLLHIWSSFFGGVLFPFLDEFLPYIYFDNQVPDGEKRRIMGFYRKTVQRFMYSRTSRHYLSKNPSFSPKIASLRETFPDARIVYLARNPLEMLPSTISWFGYIWRVFSDPLEQYPFIPEIISFTKHWYAYTLKVLDESNDDDHLIIKYNDLISDPKATIELIYKKFGYEMSAEFRAELESSSEQAGNFRSMHTYSLEKMGVSREAVLETYKDVFERFGFDMDIDGESEPQDDSVLS